MDVICPIEGTNYNLHKSLYCIPMMSYRFVYLFFLAIVTVVSAGTTKKLQPDVPEGKTRQRYVQYSCNLSGKMALERNLFLEQVQNIEAGTFTMRLTYTGGHAWIGIGVNSENAPLMTPARAIIGKAHEDDYTRFGTVKTYSLLSNADDGSRVLPIEKVNHGMFRQTSSKSILEFTHDLAEMGVTDNSTWIYAVGQPDNAWGGKHAIAGSIQMTLRDGCKRVNIPIPQQNSDAVSLESQMTMDIEPIPSNGQLDSIVLLENDFPNKSLWMVHGILMAIAWGVLVPLAIGVSLLRNQIEPYMGSFTLHLYLNLGAITCTMAGFIVSMIAKQKGGSTLDASIHHNIGISIVAIVMAQAAAGFLRPRTSRSIEYPLKGEPIIDDDDETNSCVLDASTVGGDDEEVETTWLDVASVDDDVETVWMDVDDSVLGRLPSPPKKVAEATNESEDEASVNDDQSTEKDPTPQDIAPPSKRPDLRMAWKWSHRILGFGIVGLSWYNCHTGTGWYKVHWEESLDWTSVFWGITGGISGSILVMSCINKRLTSE